jgi:hypothetical protein
MGRKFELRTSHSGLKYLFEQKNLNARKTRWLELLNEYGFHIKYIIGKENKVANALNKRVNAMNATTTCMCKSDLKNKILETVTSYAHCL